MDKNKQRQQQAAAKAWWCDHDHSSGGIHAKWEAAKVAHALQHISFVCFLMNSSNSNREFGDPHTTVAACGDSDSDSRAITATAAAGAPSLSPPPSDWHQALHPQRLPDAHALRHGEPIGEPGGDRAATPHGGSGGTALGHKATFSVAANTSITGKSAFSDPVGFGTAA